MGSFQLYARTVMLTLLTVEAAMLCARLARREAREDLLLLLVLLPCLALDELARGGLVSVLASFAVALSAANALAPRHPATRVLDVAGALASVAALVAWLAGWRGAGFALAASVLLCLLCSHPMAFIFLERTWLGSGVFAAVLGGGLLWLGGRLASFLGSGVPTPGLPFSVVIGIGIVAWWLAPDGLVSGHWYEYASSLEGRLAATEGQLREKDRLSALGLLAAAAAHEFRGALSGIGALAQWARTKESTEDKDGALGRISERVEETSRSTATLLEGIGVDGRGPERSMHLRTELGRLIGFVRATCRRDGTSVSFDVSGDPVIVARPGEIEHILLNLLHNAARAVARGGRGERRIGVRAEVRDALAVLEVEDTGGGVPESVVPKLFGPIRSGAEGSGVGLYLARSLAERNGGTVEYEPVHGGSLFRVTFPAGGAGGGGHNVASRAFS